MLNSKIRIANGKGLLMNLSGARHLEKAYKTGTKINREADT